MPKYEITEVSFIDNQLVQAGTIIETDATPAAHWLPLDKGGKKALEAEAAAEAERVAATLAEAAARAKKENAANLVPAPVGEVEQLAADAVAIAATQPAEAAEQ